MAHSTLIVASLEDARRIGGSATLDPTVYPHFHCGSLDVGIFGQMFWESSSDKRAFAEEGKPIEVVYSSSSETESVLVLGELRRRSSALCRRGLRGWIRNYRLV